MIGSVYTLTDITGREVATGHLKSEITTISIGGLSYGIYAIHLGSEAFKIIKE